MNLFTGLLEVTDAGYLLAIKVKQTRMYAGVYRDGPRGFRCTDQLAGDLSGPGACPLEHRGLVQSEAGRERGCRGVSAGERPVSITDLALR